MESTIHVFLSYLRVERALAQNSILAYGRDLKRFSEFMRKRQKNKVEDVTREDVVDFLSNLYKEKMDSRSVARYLVSMRGLYKFAMMENLVNTDPTENLESPKIRNSLPTYLRVDEINKLLEAPNLSTPIGLPCLKFCIRRDCAYPSC
jgi:integrase/recombinase XerD